MHNLDVSAERLLPRAGLVAPGLYFLGIAARFEESLFGVMLHDANDWAIREIHMPDRLLVERLVAGWVELNDIAIPLLERGFRLFLCLYGFSDTPNPKKDTAMPVCHYTDTLY